MKPCPWCGVAPAEGAHEIVDVAEVDRDAYAVGCEECGAIGPVGASREEAVSRWNAEGNCTGKDQSCTTEIR